VVTTHHTRCAAIITEPGALRSVAALQCIDAGGSCVRHATVVYAVSPALPNAPDVLAAGLRARARAWQALAT
jgi:hypothetical protein